MRSRLLFTDKQKKLFQSPKIQKQSVQLSMMCSPKSIMDQSEFNYQYSQFTMDLPINQQIRNNLKYLYELYCQICLQGGLVNVISKNKIKNIIREMSNKFPQISSLSTENVVEHYIKSCLFSFEIVLKTGKKIENQKLMLILLPKFIQNNELTQNLNNLQKGIKLFDEDIVVLCNLCENIGLSYNLFSVSKLCQRYSQEIVQGTIQISDDIDLPNSNFNQNNEDSRKSNTSQKKLNIENNSVVNSSVGFEKFNRFMVGMADRSCFLEEQQIDLTFKQFSQYFDGYPFQNYEARHKLLNKKYISKNPKQNIQKVLSINQFDPKDQFYINQIIKRVNGTLISYKQNLDILSYADEDIPGVTLPNFSIHLNNSWVGGKQQMYGMSKIDINFGPDCTEWYCIAVQNIGKFHQIFKAQYGIIIDKIEGQWFQNLDWFIQRKIPIKRLIQNKGDAIILGSGSLYWYKSKGKSLHSYWNIMPKTQKQIVTSTNKLYKSKQSIYKSIKLDKKVPTKSILLKLLNHQQFINGQKNKIQPIGLSSSSIVIIRESLKKWYIQQQKYLNQMIIKQLLNEVKFKIYNLFDAQSYCNLCKNQILIYFTHHNGLNCLQCTSKWLNSQKSMELKDKTIYYKNDVFWVYQLIYYGNIRNNQRQQNKQVKQKENFKYFPEIQQLCRKQFISNIQNCHKQLSQEYQKVQIIENQEQWNTSIQNFNKQFNQNLQYKLQQKNLNIILRAMKKQKQQQLGETKDEIIQTQYCLLNYKFKFDQDIKTSYKLSPNQQTNQQSDRISYYAKQRIQARNSDSQVSSSHGKTRDTQVKYQRKRQRKGNSSYYEAKYGQNGQKKVKREKSQEYYNNNYRGRESSRDLKKYDYEYNNYRRKNREISREKYRERQRQRSGSRNRGKGWSNRGFQSYEYGKQQKYRNQDKFRNQRQNDSGRRKNYSKYQDNRN